MAKKNAKKQRRAEERRQDAAIAAPGEETVFDPTSDYGYKEKKGKAHLDTKLGEHAVTENPEDYFNLLLAQAGVDPAGVTPFHQWLQSDAFDLTQTGFGAALLKNPKLSYQDYMEQAMRVPEDSDRLVPGPASPAPGAPAPAPPAAAAPPSFQQWLGAEHGLGLKERKNLNNARRNRLRNAYQAQHSTVADTMADAAPPGPPSLDAFVQQQVQTRQQAQQPFAPVDTGNPFTSQSAPVPGQQTAPSAAPPQRRAAAQPPLQASAAPGPRAAGGPRPLHEFVQSSLGAAGKKDTPKPPKPSLGPMMGEWRKTFQSYTPEQRGTYMSGYSPGPARWAVYG